MDIPKKLKHKPIIGVDYEQTDLNSGGGDALYLSIGEAQWNNDDISEKIFRWSEKSNKWSRQSEEVPLWRVLDMAELLIARITNQKSSLNEEIVSSSDDATFLEDYINDNICLYLPRLMRIRNLLNNYKSTELEKRPNIFSFATSELSQDAFICWLIRLADESYKDSNNELHELGLKFVNLLTGISEDEIHKVTVGRKWENIDIWVEINDNVILIIEDKTETSIHDDQLNRYKENVKSEYKGMRNEQYFVYIKTGNEPKVTLSEIEECGYKIVKRHDFLSILNLYLGNDPFVVDFRNHIQSIENKTQEFKTKSVDKWDWYAWQGFYMSLEDQIDQIDWSYVANPSGGFLGAWWHKTNVKDYDAKLYLQFEQNKFCFKIYYEGDDRTNIRNLYYGRLMGKASQYPEITKPVRFGCGTYMTIGIVNSDYLFGNDVVDLNFIVNKLHEYEKLLDMIAK